MKFKDLNIGERYEVTVDGKVFDKVKNKYLVICKTEQYDKVYINSSPYQLHRLIAFYHIPNPNNYPIINHIDGNKKNNSIENLEWCTFSQNYKHAIENNLIVQTKGEKHGSAKLTNNNVIEIYHLIEKGMMFSEVASKFSIRPQAIQDMVNGKTWKHLKLDWKPLKYSEKRKSSKTRGIWYCKISSKWRGQIVFKKVKYPTKYFKTEDEAIQALNGIKMSLGII